MTESERHCQQGNTQRDLGRLSEAIASYQKAVALRPLYINAWNNLGIALAMDGQLDEAKTAFSRVIAINPNLAQAFMNLANVFRDQGKLAEAIEATRRVVALRRVGSLAESISSYRRAIELSPTLGTAHSHLANAMMELGAVDQAFASYDRALSIQPELPDAASSRLIALHYHTDSDAALILREATAWNDRYAAPLQAFIRPHENDPNPERPLRVG